VSARRLLAAVLAGGLCAACTAPGAAGPQRSRPTPPAAASTPFPSPGARAATTGCGRPPPIPAGGGAEQEVSVNPDFAWVQGKRMYRLHVPPGYDAGHPTPVLLELHGFGGSAAGDEQGSGYDALSDREGFVVVYGQGLSSPEGAGWASVRPMELQVDELGYFAALLGQLQGQLCVDERRVYATGFSNGGGMAEMLACYMAGRIAAIAPISGNYYVDSKGPGCHPGRPVSVLAIHGTADGVVPYDGIGRAESRGWPLLPMPDFMAGWAARDGCTGGPTVFLDSGEVTGVRWEGCSAGVGVVHYRWNGGGHGAPLRIGGVPTNQAIWRFLSAYSLP
jgi:polyhydroxybutyrate depolymerase